MKPVSARLPVAATQAVDAAEPLLDLGRLGGRALVVPEQSRAQDAIAVVERDQPVHLAAQADARGRPGTARQFAEHLLRGVPPDLRVLLGPARARCLKVIRRLGARQHRAIRRQRDALQRACADVEADGRRHAPSAA